jgi:AraC-like DNA-binding protein
LDLAFLQQDLIFVIMENYYQYFPVSDNEARGVCLLNTGSTRIEKNSQYPPSAHPSHHNFNWQDGRVLQEYQLIYITRGGGLFESSNCREEVTEGSLILLQPGERHRYRPHAHSGWDETWVGFRGNMIDDIVRDNRCGRGHAVYNLGFNDTVVSLFKDINRYSRAAKPGYQPVISGAVIYLLGLISADAQQELAADARQGWSADTRHGGSAPQGWSAGTTQTSSALSKDAVVNRARAIFRDRVCDKISPEQVAEELQVSYSLFRKTFKQQTGVAPGQYLLDLKMQLARQLLADPTILIKEIAYQLNMDSPLYFCKLFKEKLGLTPMEYRRQVTGD